MEKYIDISVGIIPTCSECKSEFRYCLDLKILNESCKHQEGYHCDSCEDSVIEAALTEYSVDTLGDDEFSVISCDICNTTRGGARTPAHTIDKDGSIVHLRICPDCFEENFL